MEFMFWLGVALILSPIFLYVGRIILILVAITILEKAYSRGDFQED